MQQLCPAIIDKMKKSITKSLLILLANLLFAGISYPSTEVTTTGIASQIENFDATTESMLQDFDNAAQRNGPFVVNAFSLANLLGYPIGKAYLGSLPHFELGMAAGAGCTNMKYFDDDTPEEDKNGTWPMIIPNAVAHLGIGIGNGFDILGKFFYLSKNIYDHELSTGKARDKTDTDSSGSKEKARYDDFIIYSFGGKLRYNIIENVPLVPLLLEFSGITVSLGGDMMYGRTNMGGDYQLDLSRSSVMIGGASRNIDMQFNGTYTSVIEYSVFSLTAQVIGYVDIFYFFSFYTGFGFTGNYGFFKIEFDGTGKMLSDDLAELTGSDEVGTVNFITKNKFHPEYFFPTYIIGLEINILVVKLNVESMVNLSNGDDVNIQVGTRIGI